MTQPAVSAELSSECLVCAFSAQPTQDYHEGHEEHEEIGEGIAWTLLNLRISSNARRSSVVRRRTG